VFADVHRDEIVFPMTPLRAVIVDDEAPARERLASLLSAHAEIEVVGEAADVEPAVELCRRVGPDIVFLDVQLRTGEEEKKSEPPAQDPAPAQEPPPAGGTA
jgi:AmiR/NasT family two-component response regulator